MSSVSATYYLPGVVPHSYDEKENVCQYFHCLICVLFVFYLCYVVLSFYWIIYSRRHSLTHLLNFLLCCIYYIVHGH